MCIAKLKILTLFLYICNVFSASNKSTSWVTKKAQGQAIRLEKLVNKIEMVSTPRNFEPESWGKQHIPTNNAIFAAAMAVTLMRRDANMFCKTARKAGFTGDIVVAVLPGSSQPFLDTLKLNDVIVYNIVTECTEGMHPICNFPGQSEKFSINMIRFHLYEWWARLYSKSSVIMLSDFRDVFFQSNPFVYKSHQWSAPEYQLVVFQEAHPNKVIKRCPFNSGWIRNCYGDQALAKIGGNTVSCSGVTFGTRDAIIVYTYLMTQQLNPRIRYGKNSSVETNEGCSSTGMDQGFHNWLIYSGIIQKYMEVKVYQQGEGPVNTVGAFKQGPNALLKFPLEEWGIIKGEPPNAFIANWNGDKSPVVHQLDRFLGTVDLGDHYAQKLAAAQNLG